MSLASLIYLYASELRYAPPKTYPHLRIVTYDRFANYRNNLRLMIILSKIKLYIINKNNILFEIYMKRAMHPLRLHALIDCPDLDVDTFMTQYVESL